eukprot:TRINITY_DN19933_c0_g1_i1.p1 TRINITY_DN19933_c0_g1~~TRINITY_DN19933_c0_g1_i1.p1  ORF type:complete len:617 (+),score=165.96 TRINITY_DN19933_c0_g1_i1:65-1915(+)
MAAVARGGGIGASFGGMLATGATNNCKAGRLHIDPTDKISKAEYALALQEQIMARKAGHNLPGSDAEFQNLFGDRFNAPAAGERGMGQRHGGPMAPVAKDDYASQLKEQIAAREVRRARESSDLAQPSGLGMNFPCQEADSASAAGRGKRCAAPALGSKESYAQELQQQMAARERQRAEDLAAARLHDEGGVNGDVGAVPTPTRGKRHGKPPVPGKDDYASQLRDQMMERSMAARDAQRYAEAPSQGLGFGGPDAHSLMRGKRHNTVIEQSSRDAYHSALREQMSERNAHKEANAFHRQQPDALPEGDFRNEIFKAGGKRGSIGGEPPSKGDYASALKNQIADRQMALAAQKVMDSAIGEAPFAREAASVSGVRGRRHCSEGPALDRKALGSELREQMIDRQSRLAADAFHMQSPSGQGGGGRGGSEAQQQGGIVPRAASEGPSKGRRHVGPSEPASNPMGHMFEKQQQRAMPPRMPAAHTALGGGPAGNSPVPAEPPAASKGYGSKFARGGASLLGLGGAAMSGGAAAPSGAGGYRDPRMDNPDAAGSNFDADAHERAMIEKLVAMREHVKNDPSATQDPRRVSFKGGYHADEGHDRRSKEVNERTKSLENLLLA